jgi:hypothetical protein
MTKPQISMEFPEIKMTLIQNQTNHWQLPNGFELHSGDQVDVLIDEIWFPAMINLRPSNHFQIWMDNGQIMEITEHLTLRIRNRDYLDHIKSD